MRRLQVGIPGRHNAAQRHRGVPRRRPPVWGRTPTGCSRASRRSPAPAAGSSSRARSAGVRVVDDYAHNPGKVAAVVEHRRRARVGGRPARGGVPAAPVLAHPRLRRRSSAAALSPADVVVVMDVYAAREDPVPGVSGALVADRLDDRRADALRPVLVPGRADRGGRCVRPGDLVLTVGAGDVTMVGPRDPAPAGRARPRGTPRPPRPGARRGPGGPRRPGARDRRMSRPQPTGRRRPTRRRPRVARRRPDAGASRSPSGLASSRSRFAARAAAVRRRPWLLAAWGLAVVAVLVAGLWLVEVSPVLAARTVRVEGVPAGAVAGHP